MTQSGTQIDTLRQNEFEVLLDGAPLQGVFKVAGLTSFKLDLVKNIRVQSPIALTKIVQRDPALPFNVWLRETASGTPAATRTLAIIARDDGIEIRRWTLNKVVITEIRYSDFDTGLVELVEETVTLQYESITETWFSGE